MCRSVARTVALLTVITAFVLAVYAVILATGGLGGAGQPPPLDAATPCTVSDDLPALPCGPASCATKSVPNAQADVPVAEEAEPNAETESRCVDESKLRSTRLVPFFCRIVSARDGQPFGGAKVAVFRRWLDLKPSTTLRTDATGLFIHPVGRTTAQQFKVAPQGHESLCISYSRSHASEAKALVVRLRAEAVLVGRVTNRFGRPRPGAAVVVRPCPRPNDEWTCEARTPMLLAAEVDQDGHYRIGNLRAGESLQVELVSERPRKVSSFGRFKLATRFVQLDPGEERRIDFRFPDSSALSGRVVDQFGSPVPKAEVSITKHARVQDHQYASIVQAYTVADAVGRYRFPSVPAGKWHVEIIGKADGPAEDLVGKRVARCPIPISIPRDVPEVVRDIRTYRGLRIRGRVVDHLGRGVWGATVRARRRPIEDKIEFEVETASRGDGAVALGPLVPGEYEIEADPPCWRPNAASGMVVARDGDSGVLLRLPVGCPVSGRIMRPQVPPLCFVLRSVTAISRESDHTVKEWTTSEAFSLPALRPETYDLFIRAGKRYVGVFHGLHPIRGRLVEIPPIDCFSRGGKLLVNVEGVDGIRLWRRRMILDVFGPEGLRIRRVAVHAVPLRLLVPVGLVHLVLRADGRVRATRTASVTTDGITRVRLTMR